MKIIGFVIAAIFLFHGNADAIRYAVEESYNSLPNRDKNTPFTNSDKSQYTKLKQAISDAKPSNTECKAGSVLLKKAPKYVEDTSGKDWLFDFSTNICDSNKLLRIKELVRSLAPTLDINNITAWIYDLDNDHINDLVVGYVDVSPEYRYPYLSLWRLKFEQSTYKAYYAGPFLNGRLHAVVPFGTKSKNKVVFVNHASCIECEPLVYLTPIDFDAGDDARPYEFTYNEKHEGFVPTIEYDLPGMGHTVDAKVETRILPPSAAGPHLLQFFDMEEGPDEWWAFTCKGYKCDFQLYKQTAPDKFKTLWEKAKRL